APHRPPLGTDMSSPAVLDFAKLLADIPGDNPAGTDLRANRTPTSEFELIKGARDAARPVERQLGMGEDDGFGNKPSPPEWRPVLEKGTLVLSEKSKDLEITTYLIEALARLHNFAGVRDGFRLAYELVEKFWDKLYPRPEGADDGLDERLVKFAGLNDSDQTLIIPLAKVKITEGDTVGPFTISHYQAALALAKVADAKKREERVKQGAVTMQMMQQA